MDAAPHMLDSSTLICQTQNAGIGVDPIPEESFHAPGISPSNHC